MTKNNVLYEIFAACQTYFMAFQLFVSTYPTYSKRNSHEIRPIASLSMNLWCGDQQKNTLHGRAQNIAGFDNYFLLVVPEKHEETQFDFPVLPYRSISSAAASFRLAKCEKYFLLSTFTLFIFP